MMKEYIFLAKLSLSWSSCSSLVLIYQDRMSLQVVFYEFTHNEFLVSDVSIYLH